jgi:hypothetical protein
MWWALLAACSGGGPLPFSAPLPTDGGRYVLALRVEPDPPPLSELFVVHATLTTPDGAPVEDATVHLDATMPHHGHGMMTRPIDDAGVCDPEGACRHPGGAYLTRGFKFHMAGPWTISARVDGPAGSDRADRVYDLP